MGPSAHGDGVLGSGKAVYVFAASDISANFNTNEHANAKEHGIARRFAFTGGDFKFIDASGNTVTMPSALAGTYDIQVATVVDTGTTATEIVLIW